MKVLLDECVPKSIKPYLADLEVHTVSDTFYSFFF